MSTPSFQVKIVSPDQSVIRKATLASASFPLLKKIIFKTALASTSFSLRYTDDENDELLITNTEELQEAFRVSSLLKKTLKVFLGDATATAEPSSPRRSWKHKNAKLKSDLKTARNALQKSTTTVKSLSSYLGTSRVYSERQGKVIDLLTPVLKASSNTTTKKPCASAAALLKAKGALAPTTPVVKSLTQVLGTNRVFSQSQGRMITLREPLSRPCSRCVAKRSALRRAKQGLKPTATMTKSISQLLGTNRIYSLRQDKIITIREPKKSQNTAPSAPAPFSAADWVKNSNGKWTKRASLPSAAATPTMRAAAFIRAKQGLKRTTTTTKTITQVLGTNQIFSVRQGKIITIREPKKSQSTAPLSKYESYLNKFAPTVLSAPADWVFVSKGKWAQKASSPSAPPTTKALSVELVDSLAAAFAKTKESLKPTKTVVRSLSQVLGTNVVFSTRQGRAIVIQEPKTNTTVTTTNVEPANINVEPANHAKFSKELQLLSDLGFETEPQLYRFLLAEHGDVKKVVRWIVINMK